MDCGSCSCKHSQTTLTQIIHFTNMPTIRLIQNYNSAGSGEQSSLNSSSEYTQLKM